MHECIRFLHACLGVILTGRCVHAMQPYTINSAKVIFLKPRPQSRPFKGSGNVCLTCDRILQEPFHFCCLSCKVRNEYAYVYYTVRIY